MGNTKKEWYPMMGFVRYVLALGVLYCHVITLCSYSLPSFNLSFYSVGGFFSISGFLMYPDYMKLRHASSYVRHRARRILPAYFFIVLLCAFSLCAVSSYSLSSYFTDLQFYKYLLWNLCFLNWLEPTLPGVFNSPEYVFPAVNGSLWTMKVEWCLYLSLPIFIWFCRKFTLRHVSIAATIIFLSIVYRIGASILYDNSGNELYLILGRQVFGMLSYFYCGVFCYFYREKIKKHLCRIIVLGLALIALAQINRYIAFVLHPVGITALVLGLSMTLRNSRLGSSKNNVSYEIYLFHWPIIQLLIPLIGSGSPIVALTICIAATVILAIGYHILECRVIRPYLLFRGKK